MSILVTIKKSLQVAWSSWHNYSTEDVQKYTPLFLIIKEKPYNA
jgi:hypothetical protein